MANGQKLEKPGKSEEGNFAKMELQQQRIAELERKLQAEKERADNSEAAGSALQERLDELEDTCNNNTQKVVRHKEEEREAGLELETPMAFGQEEKEEVEGNTVIDLTDDGLHLPETPLGVPPSPLRNKRKSRPARRMRKWRDLVIWNYQDMWLPKSYLIRRTATVKTSERKDLFAKYAKRKLNKPKRRKSAV